MLIQVGKLRKEKGGFDYVGNRHNSAGFYTSRPKRRAAFAGGLSARDNTAGCTKQACAFGELYPQFREKGAVVLGVSKDSVASHKRFEEKYGLPFTLLSDTEKEVIQAYDVWKEKKNYGKVSMGVVRSTYLIDENGVIVKAFGRTGSAQCTEPVFLM